MKERPILFCGPMVRAILAGRKTQTRRVAKVHPVFIEGQWHCYYPWGEGGHGIYDTEAEMRDEYDQLMLARCPYGAPGDELWVRETWRSWVSECDEFDEEHEHEEHSFQRYVAYRATPRRGYRPVPDKATITYLDESTPLESNPRLLGPWKPAIHMPRVACRLVLPVVAVHLERLQDISEADAEAEGVSGRDAAIIFEGNVQRPDMAGTARGAFACLWDSINGQPRKRSDGSLGPDISWKANPWVWVVEFEVQR